MGARGRARGQVRCVLRFAGRKGAGTLRAAFCGWRKGDARGQVRCVIINKAIGNVICEVLSEY